MANIGITESKMGTDLRIDVRVAIILNRFRVSEKSSLLVNRFTDRFVLKSFPEKEEAAAEVQ